MRDGLSAGDRVQLHINNGKKACTRNGLDWIKRFSVGRSAALCQAGCSLPLSVSDIGRGSIHVCFEEGTLIVHCRLTLTPFG